MGEDGRFRIGVDVGDPITRGVIASFKHETTVDITTGIEFAVKNVLEHAGIGNRSDQILSLTIGTTHFINAIVQLDSTRLEKVAVIRLAAPYTTECPPFIDFPDDLSEIMNGHTAVIHGGLQMHVFSDGRIINDLRENEILEQADIIRSKGLKNIVLVGIYSPLDVEGKTEYKVRDILLKELGQEVNIVCSRDVGHVGLLERENASILNASILSFAHRTIRGYQKAMKRLGLSCPLYLTQNDGTLTTAAEAARLPIRTFSSGATNSMRGASYLAGIDLKKQESSGKSIIVVDIGGTTTDVGVLLPSGFPRQAAAFIKVAGVRTNFSMPDVHSIGLGGGSRVRLAENGQVTVGPDSVGHQLTKDALVFGGQVLTATDITVRAGYPSLCDPATVAHISNEDVVKTNDNIKHLLERVVDRMKTSPEDCDLLLVGGGSIIAPTSLRGVANIILPKFHEVANAVGAAIASVSGGVDTIEILEGKSLPETLARIKQQAIDNAVKSGADRATTRIADVNILPVQYVTNQATRIIVRAIGELAGETERVNLDGDGLDGSGFEENDDTSTTPSVIHNPLPNKEEIDYKMYKPNVVGNDWIVSETDLFFIMEGCGVLGTGGGGSPYSTYLSCYQILRDGGSIHIVDHKSLKDDDMVARGCFMGSPSVGSERLQSGQILSKGGLELAKYCGITKFSATLCDEIGGSNGMQSILMTKYFDLPALDGDLMGRAYPLLNQVLPGTVLLNPSPSFQLIPCSLNDGNGNTVILPTAKNQHSVESIMRVVATEMGSFAALCLPPLATHDVRDFGVTRSLSQAWRIGRAIAVCRQSNQLNGIAKAILEVQEGKCLFIGKIVDVSREVRAGFTWGQVEYLPNRLDENLSDAEDDATVVIPFQNENLCAYMEKNDGTRTVMASVPDLITILDSQSGSHLGTPEYIYGLRVTVIALAGHPLWRSKEGLEAGGPIAFDLQHTFVPVGEYREPRSVIEEYGTITS
ncbi:putative hydantoinase/oxoprolinase [Phlegmacium glaucopus]|nr:putative hydantoinase/oxoprolinase [Phlegmacium glaucopus]